MNLRRLIAAPLAAALVALTPLTGVAATRWFSDAHGDVASSVDVHRVRLINGTATAPAVRVTVVQRELRAGDGFDVWVDTDPGDAGPEYRASWFANSDSLGLSQVESFADPGVVVSCHAFRVRSAQDDAGERSHVLMPRPCLGNPDEVRVSVRAQRLVGQHVVKDWAPSVLHFYAWVARS